ncbi:MAG TPA: hypothetical protein VID27_14925, partial [Blastocatellia bacterium]
MAVLPLARTRARSAGFIRFSGKTKKGNLSARLFFLQFLCSLFTLCAFPAIKIRQMEDHMKEGRFAAKRLCSLLLCAILLAPLPALAQTGRQKTAKAKTPATQTNDEGYTKKILEYTTEK